MRIEITTECNMDLMGRYEDKYFPIAIIDPQFGIGESSKNHKSRNTPIKQKDGSYLKAPESNYSKKKWDDKPANTDFFNEIIRVSQQQVVFGGNYFRRLIGFTCKPPRRSEYSDFIIRNPKGYIIWDKINGSNDFNDCEVIYTSFNFDSFVVYYMWNGMMQGVEVSTDFSVANKQIGNKKLNEKRMHPTHKPSKIYFWLFEFIYSLGFCFETVLDTNVGQGTIILPCLAKNINLIACDIDEEYTSIAKQRINS